jgi:uncharacterized membrane protein SirB2
MCDFASQETCFCDYLYAVQFFVRFTYSLAKLEEQADGGWLRATPIVWQIILFLSGFLM